VTLPVVALLYDRTFLSASWRELWRRHRLAYLGLALCWGVIAWQLLAVDHGDVGLGHGVTGWEYALTSCRSHLLYLKLALWPHPLVLDYGMAFVRDWHEVWFQILALAGLIGATFVGLVRRSPLAFGGAWFFGILAPVSSVVPVLGQPFGEHRLYLSLAAVSLLLTAGLYAWLGRRAYPLLLGLALVYGGLTVQRNADYRSDLAIWGDTVAKVPDCARARVNYGSALYDSNLRAALVQYRLSAALDPNYEEPHLALGNYYARQPGGFATALAEYRTAARLRPDCASHYLVLGNLHFKRAGENAVALGYYRIARRLRPQSAEIRHNYANALLREPGRRAEALAEFRGALQLNPELPAIHLALANALADEPGGAAEAEHEFQETLRLSPGNAPCHYNLALLLARDPARRAETIAHYETTLRLDLRLVGAHFNLGLLLGQDPRRTGEALAHFEAILQLEPANERAKRMIRKLRAAPGGLTATAPADSR